MRLVCLLLIAACGSAPKFAKVASVGYGSGDQHVKFGVVTEPDHTTTYVLLDHRRGTEVSRLPRVSGVSSITWSAGELTYVVTHVGSNNQLASRFYKQRLRAFNDKGADYPLEPVSPLLKPIKTVKQLKVRGYGESATFYVVPAGTEPGLVLPIRSDGKLAWFPDGVIGATQIEREVRGQKYFVQWVVRWGGARPGWSPAMQPDLSDLDPTGPRWRSYELDTKDPVFQTDMFLYGKRFDDLCDAWTYSVDDYSATRAYHWGWGKDCKAAQSLALDHRREMSAEERRQFEERSEKEYQEALAASNAYKENRAREEKFVRDRERAVELATTAYEAKLREPLTAALENELCTIAYGLPIAEHANLVATHILKAGKYVGYEMSCFEGRMPSDADREPVRQVLATRRSKEVERAQSSSSYSGGNDSYYQQSQDNAALLKATQDWTYGRSQVCPMSVCN